MGSVTTSVSESRLDLVYTRAMQTFTVRAFWDDDAEVWVADSSQVPGLCTEATTLELLSQKLQVMIPELLENIPSDTKIHLKAHRDLSLVA